MSTSPKSKADFRQMVGDARPTTTTSPDGSPMKSTLSASDVHHTLSAQVGQLDLGFIGNMKARFHQRAQDTRMQRTLTTARVEQATALMIEKISGEAEIVRMAFRADFSDRIASLAEGAVASQFLIMRKLKVLENEARRFVMVDLSEELDRLADLHRKGVLDDKDLEQEVTFQFARYEQLKAEFVKLMDGYQTVVQNAYQGDSR